LKTSSHTKPADIELLEFAKFPVLFAPFHGATVPVKLCELTEIQIMECGDISLIETLADKITKGHDIRKVKEAVKYAETLHKITRAALIAPTYQEILDMVGAKLNNAEIKKHLDELQKQVIPLSPTSTQRQELEEDIRRIRIWVDLILPSDFLNFVSCYSLGVNKTDIKKINEKMLLDFAILAEKAHKAPHEMIEGTFSSFNKHDIDRRAWYELYKFREREQNKKKAG